LAGDKVLTISPGTNSKTIVKDNAAIKSIQAIEMDDVEALKVVWTMPVSSLMNLLNSL
jgi:hypothetical protein